MENGVNVLLDRYELKPGSNLSHFMEHSLSIADKVLVIFTPNYKLKAEKRQGGVGLEYSILNSKLYENITTNNKYIPILRKGSSADSVPAFMRQFIRLDMQSDEQGIQIPFLLRVIHDEPELVKPSISPRPNFKVASSQSEVLKQKLYSILDKINPIIRINFKNGARTVGVMISLPNLFQLELLKEEFEEAGLLSYHSNGNIIMGGSGNRIGNHVNDLNESLMRGFILEKLEQF